MTNLKGRDLLGIADLSSEEIDYLLTFAGELKEKKKSPKYDKTLGLLFTKASTRTRVSFTVAMYQMGGQVIDLNPNVTQVGRGEPLQDTARVLNGYLDVLAIRTFAQKDLEIFAKYCDIPIINALTDLEHPCQILADLLTIKECFGSLKGITLAYVGDGNNVANSLVLGGALAGVNVRIVTPEDYQVDKNIIEKAKEIAQSDTEIIATTDPIAGVKSANVIYTDVWASMGQEDLADSRIPTFLPYQLNDELINNADSDAIVLHCLPAHRGEEITESVMEGNRSRIWQQAENRMHAQKALLASIL